MVALGGHGMRVRALKTTTPSRLGRTVERFSPQLRQCWPRQRCNVRPTWEGWSVLEKSSYEESIASFRSLGPKVESLLRELLSVRGVRVHEVSHRIKKKESAEQKVSRMGPSSSVDDLTDLLGLRVITYFPSEVDEVADLVEREFAFDPDRSTDKGKLLDPDRFGYLSQHYIASLKDPRASLTEYLPYSSLVFEIQIRSILQHAWAEIEHDLGYKSKTAIPREVRRRFSRLAGLLEIADYEFEGIQKDLSDIQTEVRAEISQGTAGNVRLDQASLMAFMSESSAWAAREEQICLSADIAYFEDDLGEWGRMVDRLLETGIKTIGDLERFLEREGEILHRFAVAWLTNDYEVSRDTGPLPDNMSHGFLAFYVWLLQVARDNSGQANHWLSQYRFADPEGVLVDLRRALAAAEAQGDS